MSDIYQGSNPEMMWLKWAGGAFLGEGNGILKKEVPDIVAIITSHNQTSDQSHENNSSSS